MLSRGSDRPLVVEGYLVTVEREPDGRTSAHQIALRLADGLTYLDDVGAVHVEELGVIDIAPESEAK